MPSLPTPTPKTAAIAGVWSAIGLTVNDVWTSRHPTASVGEGNLVFLVGAALFFFLPVFVLVLGVNRPFAWNWFTQSEERARYGEVVKRLLAWFVAGGAALLVLGLFTH